MANMHDEDPCADVTSFSEFTSAEFRSRRLQAGVTVEVMADLAGVSTETISSFETVTRHPRKASIDALVGALLQAETK
jgi:transcriptional regulator with XRE-family HTH domain